MKRFLSLFFLIPAFYGCIVAQDPVRQRYAAEINPEAAKAHLSILASAAFEGRGTGEAGGERAAAYIASEFEKLGLTAPVNGSYFQPVKLVRTSFEVKDFAIDGKSFVNGKDFYFVGNGPETSVDAKEIVFIGYGISEGKYDDLKGIDIKGKVVLLLSEGEPKNAQGNSLITGTDTPSEWVTSRTKRLQNITAKEPKLIIAVSNTIKESLERFGARLVQPRISLEEGANQPVINTTPVANISTEMADLLLRGAKMTITALEQQINNTQQPQTKTYSGRFHTAFGTVITPFTSPNVLGYLEGTDLKGELVVISSHYDHDGNQNGTIFFGADDNGSGTTGVLTLARAYTKAKAEGHGPRRSILFITFTAEEKGLLGSNYYARNPVFPLESTVVNLNMDMIGRIDDKHLRGNHNYVHAIGSDKLSSELKAINENANAEYTHMELDYMYDDPKDPMRIYYRSDQYNFAKHGIPVVFYFSGLHPDYHTPADTVDKIDFEMLARRAQLVFYTAWEVANRDKRLVVDSNKE
ncbi:M28 family peptidase [Parapedobacter koreensis]|uniref:Zn-dependent amino-or carboxypeptidase, M28 family n=1 Tax=Parapedobacter koreensis TaxID=332977 RepID=A0A1H7STX2_9SPHI|nr:M28 family peptidase [Parapedobacter koreensis]SEL75546.1 Zn-dependent amino-or carboxypeptidase, M28 family [Parapedobacter koreensis]